MDRRNAQLKVLVLSVFGFHLFMELERCGASSSFPSGVICGAKRWCCMLNDRCGTGMLSSPIHGHQGTHADWELIGYDGMDEIRSAGLSDKREESPRSSRCLLCRPRVGNESQHGQNLHHTSEPSSLCTHDDKHTCSHHIERADVKRGVHY